MDQQKKNKQFAKLLDYILGRRPDEFGLALDQNGFVKIKELIKAMNEDNSWKHIKKSNIDEILIAISNPPIEIDENKIRAINRKMLLKPEIPIEMPKTIYTCIRKKAHPYVMEKGISPSHNDIIVLSSDLGMAERIGNRQDSNCILLNVNVQQAEKKGVLFSKYGKTLYLAKFIPADCFLGPPLPKQKPEAKKRPAKETKKQITFNEIMSDDNTSNKETTDKKNSKRNRTSWKNNKKRLRKIQKKEWPM